MIELNILLATSVTLAVIHTLIGVDHYLPFIVIAKANNWTVKKTMLVVFICGIGHVAGSVTLGIAGILLASGVSKLIDIENIRGQIAAYFMILFGFIYTVYGIRYAVKNKPHRHLAQEGHTFKHAHAEDEGNHEHNAAESKNQSKTIWGLFILLLLCPCESLIPLLMYPAASHNIPAVILVILSFTIFIIGTMLLLTFLGLKGLRMLKTEKIERYTHVIAGTAVLLCGVLILILPI